MSTFLRYLILVLFALAVLIGVGYLVQKDWRRAVNNSLPPITEEQARAMAVQAWGDCSARDCDRMTVSISPGPDESQIVTATYEGLKDDSVGAEQWRAPVIVQEGSLALGEKEVAWRCQPGRGHQDFSRELCI